MINPAPQQAGTPYRQLGGPEPVRKLVDRFYDLMDKDPAYAALRALHAADLSPMRVSLTSFLVGWLGGPRDWFDAQPGRCVMSAHKAIPVTAETAAQWTDAMSRALADTGIEPTLAEMIDNAFRRMAQGMVKRPS